MTFALPLPNGRVQFLDHNGEPLVSGTVGFYIPGSLTPKDTYQDYGATILNANPLTLDALGSAAIWGIGRYRQIVKDSLGNQVWDQETATFLTTLLYEAGFYFVDAPNANDIIGVWNFTQNVTFPTNFSDGASLISYGSVNTNPSNAISVDIKKVAGGVTTTIGEMAISTLGVVTLTSNISTPTFAPGDRLLWQVQSGGAASVAGLACTLAGEITMVA